MGYVPLNNYNHDGGYKRIQSGPNHQGFIVLTSGSTAYGANEGIVVPGSPLSGTAALGAWDYDSNWRYVPSTLPGQSGVLDPTPYNVSGALDTYDATRIYTRDNVAGAQAASAIGPETGKVNPRGGALQARSDVTRPETYMYYGGAAPDNQDYSPYNTPDANSAAEGKTGGGVTHRSFESSLLTNVLGSQGTSDRSQWRYHQPVYCKTYTETRRSETPGLMSTPLRYVYRGSASSYNYNYGSELLANKGGFELLPYDDEVLGCPFPVGCPTKDGSPTQIIVGDTLSAVVYCNFVSIEWFNTNNVFVGSGITYTVTAGDVGYKIYYVVTYPDNSTDTSSVDCYPVVIEQSLRLWYSLSSSSSSLLQRYIYSSVVDNNGDMYVAYAEGVDKLFPSVAKVSNNLTLYWRNVYALDPSLQARLFNNFGSSYFLLDVSSSSLDFLAWQWTVGPSPFFVTYPVRIYRCRVNKVTGALESLLAVDWTPPGSPSPLFIEIRDVKIDANNNYYFVANLPISGATSTPCIVKFNQDLEFQWAKVPQRLVYTGSGLCNLTLASTNDKISITISDSELIGCVYATVTGNVTSTYFRLSSEGAVLDSFKAKFIGPDFNDVNNPPLRVYSVCRDEEGNIYGVGSNDTTSPGTFTPIIVYKDTIDDVTVWSIQFKDMLGVARRRLTLGGNQLLLRDSRLVFAVPWETSTAPVVRTLLICIFDPDTGVLETALDISPPGGDIGSLLILEPLPEDTKFFVQTQLGFRVRLDITDLPSNGLYQCSDNPTQFYTASGLTPVQATQPLYRFNSCPNSNPSFSDYLIGSYFSPVSSPVVTASGATSGNFRFFAGQDTP